MERDLEYWRRLLAGYPTELRLPTDRPRPAVLEPRGRVLHIDWGSDLGERLDGLCRDLGATPFVVLMTVFQVLLSHLTGQQRLLVGSDLTQRSHRALEGLVGFFVQQLVIPGDLRGNPTFDNLVYRTSRRYLDLYSRQRVPFETLVRTLGVKRRMNRSPVVQAKLIVQNMPVPTLELPDLAMSPLAVEKSEAQQDLVLALWQEPTTGLRGWVNFNSTLFDATTVGDWLRSFRALLATVVDRPRIHLDELEGDLVAQRMQWRQRMSTTSTQDSLGDLDFSDFKSAEPAASDPAAGGLVEVSTCGDASLPSVFTASSPDVDLVTWAAEHREEVDGELLEHGAVLFRGFDVEDATTFGALAEAVCDELFQENGEHPHEALEGNVYTPVFYSPSSKLLWHNENTFNQRFPRKIMFGCVLPAESGGETPVVDSRQVYRSIDEAVRDEFEAKGVAYLRNYGTGLGLGWREVFLTDDRADVEAYCRENGFEWTWKGEDGLRTVCRRPAVFTHPVSGEKVWINQAQHWHLSCLAEAAQESLTALFATEDLPRHCTFGDGSPIPDSHMMHILDVYGQLESAFPWQRGDVMLVDNILAAHARNPYEGDRKLLVAMGEMASFDPS